MEEDQTSIFKRIREVVKTIPRGKVATYGQVAKVVGTKDARLVGWALRGNADPKIPCHRVVRSMGYLADNYSLGTWKGQKERLAKEGVNFSRDQQVDMNRHHWFRHVSLSE